MHYPLCLLHNGSKACWNNILRLHCLVIGHFFTVVKSKLTSKQISSVAFVLDSGIHIKHCLKHRSHGGKEHHKGHRYPGSPKLPEIVACAPEDSNGMQRNARLVPNDPKALLM